MLDTHIWLWYSLGPKRISPELLAKIVDTQNELWLSPITVSEPTYRRHFVKPYEFTISGGGNVTCFYVVF